MSEPAKKRRLRGACDICRHQKIRCDSAVMGPLGRRCSNCASFNSECTHTVQLKEAKGPRRKRTNVQPSTIPEGQWLPPESVVQPESQTSPTASLSDPIRVVDGARNIVDGLLRQTYTTPQDHEALLELLHEISRYARQLEQELDIYRQSQSPPSDRVSSTAVPPESNHQDAQEDSGVVVDIQKLPEHLKRITMDAANHRFFGKNSSVMFVRAAMEARLGSTNVSVQPLTRPKYWTPLPYQAFPEPVVTQTFPPADLLRDLVDIYFTQINIFWFILHRPTFEKSIADGLHHRNADFGAIVLVVAALASKNSHDKRVLLPGEGELSAGWEWFRQIRRPFSGHVVRTASLYELQLCCLYISFQQTGSDLESCWLLCGTGILHAQDIGADRLLASGTGKPSTVEDELIRRSCFFLSIFNSIASACFGRTRVTIPGDCELSRLTASDDEYWEHPDPKIAFTQPPGKPALSEFLNAHIYLVKIFTLSWRTSGPPPDYTGARLLEPETVAELDSRLDKWASQIPEHLLWNPYQENEIFFEQSVALHASYYHLQILVHRPFLTPSVSSASTIRSLAICTNAARSCATVAEVKSRRGIMPNHHLVKAVFDSAIVLLFTISGGTQSGLALDVDRELTDVYKCMTLLRQTETRWQNAGRFYDCLCEILNASNFPLPATSEPASKLSYDISYEHESRSEMNPGADQTGSSWADEFLSLPMAVDDLGSLPIYGSLDSPDKPLPDSHFGPLPPYSFARIPPLGDMDTDHYLSPWMPYLSTVGEVAQAIQDSSSGI